MATLHDALASRSMTAFLGAALQNDTIRGAAMKVAEKRLYRRIVERNIYDQPLRGQMDKFYLMRNMLHALDTALREKRISPQVGASFFKVMLGSVFADDISQRVEITMREGPGSAPPSFLTISPTKTCNLRCTGCYASSSAHDAEILDYEVLDRIVSEKTALWNSHFTVISGGEPLMYRSRGKGLLDLAREHSDNYFMFYTNGTLIDQNMAEALAEVGNMSPAISVEGMEAETDARRGKGVHHKILRAFQSLQEAGVPFGISATATRFNAETLVSDRFVDFYFGEQKAMYGWIFHYMPIGRRFTLDLMITPQQRRMMYEREQRFIRDRGVFLADFWNSGTVSDGCISAGRTGGYFYIDWNGNVTPCVFFPYSTHNILEVYRNGGDLNTVLHSPFFDSIRKWHRAYGYLQPADRVKNRIVPCAIRDHYRMAHSTIERFGARPIDEAAAEALKDEIYREDLIAYGEAVGAATDDIWEQEYVGPEKVRRMEQKDHEVAAG